MSEREVPEQFSAFACGEYFATDAFRRGVFEVSTQVYLVAPIEQLRIVPEHNFLAVGRPGVDGIEFGFVAGQPGVWALYPSEGRLAPVAQSLAGLLSGWTAGSISV